ncbi:MAG: polysaccharide biosynthesis tyrosine autokinase [Bacteroidales bacterium]|nr:polysaccharide biosynthesis tyrosine autokinase [Bacteroidales bacterium]
MNKQLTKQGTFSIDSIIQIIRKKWMIIGTSVIICLLIAFFYIWITEPLYQVSSSILITEDESSYAKASAQFMEGFGLFGGQKNFQNEIKVIKSSVVIKEAIRNLNFQVSYFNRNTFRTQELYKSSPFVVVYNQNHVQPVDRMFYVKIKDNQSLHISIKQEKVNLYSFNTNNIVETLPKLKANIQASFGENLTSDYYDFKLILNENFEFNKLRSKRFAFVIHSPKGLLNYYRSKVEIVPDDLESTVAVVKMKTHVPEKAIDFINSLTSTYLLQDLDKKTHMAQKTVEYIDNQLNVIEDSLKIAEQNLQRYRTTTKVIDIAAKSGRVYDQLQELEREKANISVKYKYYKYLEETFNKGDKFSDLIAPSTMGVEDPLLNNLIQELLQLNSERTSLIENNQEKSPYLRKLEINIENLKNTISENIKYIINTTDITLQDINSRLNTLNYEINKLPRTERELLGYERKFNINDAIYTYLLEKRAEAQITNAAYLPDAEIIEYADLIGNGPISPKKKQVYLVGLMVGLILPLTVFRIIDLTNKKVKDKTQLESLIDIPFIGQVYSNHKKTDMVVTIYPKSHIAESFRMVRANLNYFLMNKKNVIIAVTSTFGQEGKSFVSANLAASLASSSFKTIVLGYDLRKPKLFDRLKDNKHPGISEFLCNQVGMEQIIQPSGINNLDVIIAGITPPNPSELITSPKTIELLNFLRSRYEYIVIDTPPIGIISDAYIIMDKADLNIYIVRQNSTLKNEMVSIIGELKEKQYKNLCVLLNDVPVLHKTKYGYDYYEKV